MPSLTAARWVGQKSGPIFCGLWTKVHHIKFAGVSVRSFMFFFRQIMSCCIPEIFTIKS